MKQWFPFEGKLKIHFKPTSLFLNSHWNAAENSKVTLPEVSNKGSYSGSYDRQGFDAIQNTQLTSQGTLWMTLTLIRPVWFKAWQIRKQTCMEYTSSNNSFPALLNKTTRQKQNISAHSRTGLTVILLFSPRLLNKRKWFIISSNQLIPVLYQNVLCACH